MSTYSFTCPITQTTSTKSFPQRCLEFCPSYAPPVIDEDKIFVTYNGVGEADVYEYLLGRWVNGEFEVIEKKCGKEALFLCIPDGDYTIVLVAGIRNPKDNSFCIKKYDACNFDCLGNPTGGTVTLTINNPCNAVLFSTGSTGLKGKNGNIWTFFKNGKAVIVPQFNPGDELDSIVFSTGSDIMSVSQSVTINCKKQQSDLYVDITNCPGAQVTVTQDCGVPASIGQQSDSTATRLHYRTTYGCHYTVTAVQTNFTVNLSGDTDFVADNSIKNASVSCISVGNNIFIDYPPVVPGCNCLDCSGLLVEIKPFGQAAFETYDPMKIYPNGQTVIRASKNGVALEIKALGTTCQINSPGCDDVRGGNAISLTTNLSNSNNHFSIICTAMCAAIDFNYLTPGTGNINPLYSLTGNKQSLKIHLYRSINSDLNFARQNLEEVATSIPQFVGVSGPLEINKYVVNVIGIEDSNGFITYYGADLTTNSNLPNEVGLPYQQIHKLKGQTQALQLQPMSNLANSACLRYYRRIVEQNTVSGATCNPDTHGLQPRPTEAQYQQFIASNQNFTNLDATGLSYTSLDSGAVRVAEFKWTDTCNSNACEKITYVIYDFTTESWNYASFMFQYSASKACVSDNKPLNNSPAVINI